MVPTLPIHPYTHTHTHTHTHNTVSKQGQDNYNSNLCFEKRFTAMMKAWGVSIVRAVTPDEWSSSLRPSLLSGRNAFVHCSLWTLVLISENLFIILLGHIWTGECRPHTTSGTCNEPFLSENKIGAQGSKILEDLFFSRLTNGFFSKSQKNLTTGSFVSAT